MVLAQLGKMSSIHYKYLDVYHVLIESQNQNKYMSGILQSDNIKILK